jgi:formylglycine-generating enzyme required for sulfatase activity/serine/threonine protein kinase
LVIRSYAPGLSGNKALPFFFPANEARNGKTSHDIAESHSRRCSPQSWSDAMSGQAATVESIFLEAVERIAPADRDAFLNEACAGDAALRGRVEALLRAHDDAGSFLATPAFASDACETHVLHPLGANTPSLGGERTDPGTSDSDDLSLDFLDAPRQAGLLGALGPYDVTEFVGQGGMGVVLKAHDPRLNRVVAIKVLAPALALNAAARKRFLREAQAAAAVTHDHVVAIHAIEESKRLPLLVMEYVAGQSLQQKIDSTGPLAVKEIVRIGRQIAAGLAAAHEQGLIHRDIKPANILLENGVERVKITDFGLARAVGDVAVTQTGLLAGTPQYMSPEQAHGQRVDYRSDLFSLGSVLYAMCTGRPPFRGESPVTVIRRVCEETPTPISQINPDVPDWLVRIVDRLLAKDPEQRYQSAAELMELLGQCLEHLQQPTLREPPIIPQLSGATSEAAADVVSLPQQRSFLAGTVRNHRWAAAALILLLVGAGLGATEATGVTDVSGFVATVLRIRTPQGTLVVELNDPAASVAVDADDETITFSGIGPHEIKLRPGRHPVRALKDGKAVRTEWVTITRGDRQVVKLHLEQAGQAEKRRSPASAAEARELQSQWAKKLDLPDFQNSLGMRLVLIPPGVFEMGGDDDEIKDLRLDGDWYFVKWIPERLAAEQPKHRVELTKPFYMGVHEVTVGQFSKFIEATGYKTTAQRDGRGGYGYDRGDDQGHALKPSGWTQDVQYNWKNPGFPQSAEHPVNNVSWDDAVAFCKWLSEKEKVEYRLPTEAEWEYACRAGTTTAFYSGNRDIDLRWVANIALGSILDRVETWSDPHVFTAPVGSYKANAFGLHDMHGNVWEWCSDWYDAKYYRVSPTVDPQGPNAGEHHVFRGGGWDNHPIFCRSADRFSSHYSMDSPMIRTNWAGFRVVRVIAGDISTGSANEDATSAGPTRPQTIDGGVPPLQAVIKDALRKGKARAVALATGGRSLAVGRDDGTFELWDVQKKEIIHSENLPASVTAVAISANGQWMAAARGTGDSREAMVHLWDLSLKENDPIAVSLGGGPTGTKSPEWNVNTGPVRSLAFSSNGKLLVAGTGDDQAGELIVWSTEDFNVKSRFPGFAGGVRLLSIGPDNQTTLAGSSDGSMQILDLKAGTVVTKMNFAMTFPQEKNQKQPHLVQSLAYMSAERGLIATGDGRGSVSILAFPSGGERLSFKADDAAIEALAFSPEGRLLATVGRDDSAVQVWNIAEKIR